VEADRLRPGWLPEDVVLEDAHTAVVRELRGEAPRPLGEHLRRDDVVRLPRVAELPRAVFGVTSRNPVHLVGSNAGLVLALEQGHVPLAQKLQASLGDQTALDDDEAVLSKGGDLVGRERVDQERGLALSGS
jgi:hypothetical protein